MTNADPDPTNQAGDEFSPENSAPGLIPPDVPDDDESTEPAAAEEESEQVDRDSEESFPASDPPANY